MLQVTENIDGHNLENLLKDANANYINLDS